MKRNFPIPLLLCFVAAASAYSTISKGFAPPTTRRKVLTNVLSTAATSTAAIVGNPSSAHAASTKSKDSASPATQACRDNSRNCIRTTWTPPPSHTQSQLISDLQQILSSYPQKGQNGVDCNGLKVAQDNLSTDGNSRTEFYSCIGPAAISMNLGKPFVDDVWLQLVPTVPTVPADEGAAGTAGTAYKVEVKCNRRVGVTDYGASKKRINYLSEELRKKHWDVPTVSY